jgi:hypothetical protein
MRCEIIAESRDETNHFDKAPVRLFLPQYVLYSTYLSAASWYSTNEYIGMVYILPVRFVRECRYSMSENTEVPGTLSFLLAFVRVPSHLERAAQSCVHYPQPPHRSHGEPLRVHPVQVLQQIAAFFFILHLLRTWVFESSKPEKQRKVQHRHPPEYVSYLHDRCNATYFEAPGPSGIHPLSYHSAYSYGAAR